MRWSFSPPRFSWPAARLKPRRPKNERPVQVQRVAFENGGAAREFVGAVRARHETDLGFRVSGKVVERAVNVGDRVRDRRRDRAA